LSLLVREIRSFRDLLRSVRKFGAKRASLRALAKNPAGEKVLLLLRCALWLVTRSAGASLGRWTGQ